MNTTIQELHAEVWAFRREMQDYFPTPNQADSLAFAFTEVAEAVDATLRQNPLYKRNQDKAHTVERELAQTALMLLTAIPEEWTLDPVFATWGLVYRRHGLGWLAERIAGFYAAQHADPYSIVECIDAINRLIVLPVVLQAELARMRAKHGPATDDGPASQNEPANEHPFHYSDRMEKLLLSDYTERIEL